MPTADPEVESLRSELKALKDWLTILNQNDPELRFRALVEKGSDGIAVVDRDGVFLYATPSSVRLLGYSPDELMGRRFFEMVHPDERDENGARFDECIVTPRTEIHSLMRVRHRDGSWRYMDCIFVNRIDEPCVRGVVLNFRDVTVFIAAETEQRIRSLEQTVVANLGLSALKVTTLDVLLREAVLRCSEVLSVEHCMVLELLPAGESLLLRAGAGWKENLVGTAIVSAKLDSQMGYTLTQSDAVIIADIRTETRFKVPSLLEEGASADFGVQWVCPVILPDIAVEGAA